MSSTRLILLAPLCCNMKEQMLSEMGYDDWTTDYAGVLICPHGNRCEDDQRSGLAECGCVSPLAEIGMI